MSIYAGIPSGAYNSEAAMLYGGLAPDDFNDNMTYNLLMPWFTRNNITEAGADAIAHDVTAYLKAAAKFRLNRDGTDLAAFWKRFAAMDDEQRDILRKAVNYVRHKKHIPLGVMSRRLAEAKDWAEALPYLRAVPGIGKKYPRPLLHWLGMNPINRELQLTRWRHIVPQVDVMGLDPPARTKFIPPTPHQLALLDRRIRMANRAAEQRRELLRDFPPIRPPPRTDISPEIAALRKRIREQQRARLLSTLQDEIPDAKLESTY